MNTPRAAVMGLALTLTACGIFGGSKSDGLREDIVETALDQVGEDYEYGGNNPSDGFDCSGLVQYSYAENGIKLPRTAAEQRNAGKHIKLAEAKPGDLLFYNFKGAKPTGWHVAIYLGDGEAVHAPTSDKGEVEKIDITKGHWRERFIGATRVID
jgi:cell wall-associated NlpC family hydrolase